MARELAAEMASAEQVDIPADQKAPIFFMWSEGCLGLSLSREKHLSARERVSGDRSE
jgi:hypothetical protein